MSIKFKVIFKDGTITFVEYLFSSWKSFDFDMIHYNKDDIKIDNKAVYNFSVKNAMKNLITRGKQNDAQFIIIKRSVNNEIHI